MNHKFDRGSNFLLQKYIQKVRKSSRDCLPPPKHELTPEVKVWMDLVKPFKFTIFLR